MRPDLVESPSAAGDRLRAIVLFLIFANLAFFAWSMLIDVPPPPPNDSISRLPRLKLLSEARAAGAAAPAVSANQAISQVGVRSGDLAIAPLSTAAPGQPAQSAPVSPASPVTSPSTSAGSAANSGTPVGATPPTSQAGRAGPAAVPAGAASHPTASRDLPGDEADRCVAVGPFGTSRAVSEAAVLLRQRGFDPRPRLVARAAESGYWVYIGGLGSTQAADALRRLEQHDVSDARIMPARDGERRVSVGLFRKRADAERRAGVVRGLGFAVTIESEPGAGAARWIDVDLGSSANVIPAEALLSLEGSGSSLTIEECPSRQVSKPTLANPLSASASRPG